MFAIIRTGGKQQKVSPNDKVFVEKLDAEIGSEVVLDQVLMVSNDGSVTVGSPLVAGASVKAKVEEQTRTKKIIVFKKKRRQNYRRKKGHRQHQTVLRISEIVVGGKATKAAPKKAAEKKEAATAKKAAPKKAPAKKA